jgi:hypothetical protein
MGFQFRLIPPVSGLIALDLRVPVASVANGRAIMLRAAVPETTVYKDCEACFAEGEIGARATDFLAQSVTDPPLPQVSSEEHLRGGVSAPDGTHVSAAPSRRDSVTAYPQI